MHIKGFSLFDWGVNMGFIEIIKAIVYGIVEGITEWLPVSSTGHLILLNDIMPMNVSPEFWSVFMVVIQLGAIVAVVINLWDKIWPINTKVPDKPLVRLDVLNLWFKIIVACIPAVIVGLLLDDWIDAHLYKPVVVAVMLIIVGIAFIVVEEKNKGLPPHVNTLRQLTIRDALVIGLFQVVAALLPGTSRSGATIIGALLLGVSRTVAVEFTFCMSIPVMAGASLLKLVKYGMAFSGIEFLTLFISCMVAFLVSMACIKFILNYIKTHDFKIFGYYRIILGAMVLIYFFLLKK